MDYYESCGCLHSKAKMCPMHTYIWETKCAAARLAANPPKLPWQLNFRRWVDSLGGSVDIWELLAVVLLIRLIFG